MATIGVALPIAPTKRQVTIFETNVRPVKRLPALFFPPGLYLMHEDEGVFMCGKSLADAYIRYDDFRWDRKQFEAVVWQELAEYIPAFDRLKVLRILTIRSQHVR